MKFENIFNSVAISSVSGILSAAIVIERERLDYPSFFLFVVCAICFSVGSLSVFLCEKKRDKKFGLATMLFGVLIFLFTLIVTLILRL